MKIDVAFFGWFWLIVESRNILCLRRPLHANSSIAEVKKECVEAFACKSFYVLLLFLSATLELLFLCLRGGVESAMKLKPHWALQLHKVTFQVTTFFIYSFSMHKSSKWVLHHLQTTSSLIGSLFCSYYSNFS